MNQFGLLQVTIPFPFWNQHVHCYLAQREGKWTIIDTGLLRHETEQTWNTIFKDYNIVPKKHVERILLTHHHADHTGYAGVLQKESQAMVQMHEKELGLLEYEWDEIHFTQFLLEHGMPQPLVQRLRSNDTAYKQMIHPSPVNIQPIKEGELIPIGELLFQPILTPGHSDGHICFYNKEEKILITGDHLTKDVIPNISYQGYGDKNPLATYLTTLRKMQNMEISKVYPGHGPIFTDVKEWIEELIRHYEKQLAITFDGIKSVMTAYEVSQALAKKTMGDLEQWIILGETNALLAYLVSIGEIECFKDGLVYKYRRGTSSHHNKMDGVNCQWQN